MYVEHHIGINSLPLKQSECPFSSQLKIFCSVSYHIIKQSITIHLTLNMIFSAQSVPEGCTYISLNTALHLSGSQHNIFCSVSARRMHIHIIKHSDNIFLAHTRIFSAQSVPEECTFISLNTALHLSGSQQNIFCSVPEGFTFISLNTVITSSWLTSEYCLLSQCQKNAHSYH